MLLAAFAKLAAEFPGTRLVLAGRNDADVVNRSAVASMLDYIAKAGLEEKVKILDWMPYEELSRLYLASDIGVDSRSMKRGRVEGFSPLKTMDYMSHGLVTVAADCPEIREVASGGVLLFEPDSEADLHDKLRSAVKMVLSGERRAALDGAGRTWTWDDRASVLGSLYRRISGEGNG